VNRFRWGWIISVGLVLGVLAGLWLVLTLQQMHGAPVPTTPPDEGNRVTSEGGAFSAIRPSDWHVSGYRRMPKSLGFSSTLQGSRPKQLIFLLASCGDVEEEETAWREGGRRVYIQHNRHRGAHCFRVMFHTPNRPAGEREEWSLPGGVQAFIDSLRLEKPAVR
jgi:hypothetical protein